MSETHEVTITRVLPKEGKRPAKIMTEEGHEPTTFKDEIASAATALVGKRARIEIDRQQRGEWENVYLNKVEPLAETNGSTPAVTSSASPSPAVGGESDKKRKDIFACVALEHAVATFEDSPLAATPKQLAEKIEPLAHAYFLALLRLAAPELITDKDIPF